jgi:hypothetical protein
MSYSAAEKKFLTIKTSTQKIPARRLKPVRFGSEMIYLNNSVKSVFVLNRKYYILLTRNDINGVMLKSVGASFYEKIEHSVISSRW